MRPQARQFKRYTVSKHTVAEFTGFGWLDLGCPAGLAIAILSISALAQTLTVVPDNEAAQHVGQHVTVEGVVVKVFTSKGGNTFLKFGGPYPRQTFTGWIPSSTPLASDPATQSLQGKKIKITVKIELYRGKPEIKVLSRDQITEEQSRGMTPGGLKRVFQ